MKRNSLTTPDNNKENNNIKKSSLSSKERLGITRSSS